MTRLKDSSDTSEAQHPTSKLSRLRSIRLLRSKSGLVGLVLVGCVVCITVFAPLIAPDPECRLTARILERPNQHSVLGTDADGRDIFSCIVMGSRETFLLAVLALALAASAGALIGLVTAYKKGAVDMVLSRVMDVLLSFPSIMVALLVLVIFRQAGRGPIVVAVAFTLLPRFARIVRGSALPIVEEDYVSAARAISASGLRIITRHVLPNLIGPLVVLLTTYLPYVILLEATLSFLGIGSPPSVPTWGRIIAEGKAFLRTAPWVSLAPGVAIMVTVLGFNLLGDGLRDVLDPTTAYRVGLGQR